MLPASWVRAAIIRSTPHWHNKQVTIACRAAWGGVESGNVPTQDWFLCMPRHPLPGMRQLEKIEPDVVHPGIGTANVRRDSPALDKIPPHMMQIKPVEDQVCCVVHGELIHLPDNLLARLRVGDELLLRVESSYLSHRMPLVPAATVVNIP